RSPSRSGSSPRRTSISRTRSWNGTSVRSRRSSAIVFHPVPRRLPQHEPLQRHAARQRRAQPLPDRDDQVLRRRIPTAHPLDAQLQMTMVHIRHHTLFHRIAQRLQVVDEARLRIDLTRDRDIQLVVVSVPVRVRTVTEHATVLLRTPVIAAQPMRRTEMHAAGHLDTWHFPRLALSPRSTYCDCASIGSGRSVSVSGGMNACVEVAPGLRGSGAPWLWAMAQYGPLCTCTCACACACAAVTRLTRPARAHAQGFRLPHSPPLLSPFSPRSKKTTGPRSARAGVTDVPKVF